MRALLLLALAGCAPSRAEIFQPVADAVRARTGATVEWQPGAGRSAAAEARIQELLAAPLTAESAALVAVLASPALQADYAELAAANARLASAAALPNPQVEAQLRFPLDDDGQGNRAQIELSAVESISGLVAVLPRSRAANAELRAVRRRAVAATFDVAARARAAYYAAVAADQQLALRREGAEAAAASAELAGALRKAGNLTALALATERVHEEEAALAVQEAEAEVAASRERVNAVLGLFGAQTGWRTGGRLPEPPADPPAVDDLEEAAVAASLPLEELRWRLVAAGRAIGVARIESLLPDLGAGVSAKREGVWGVGPMLTLTIPIFDWGGGRRGAAWAELSRLQHRYAAVAIEVRAAARTARIRVASAYARARRMKERLLPLRDQLAAESLAQYNAMNVDAFELLVARREQLAAEERRVAAVRDYWIAQSEVDQLRAGGLPHARSDGEEQQP